MRIDRGVGVPDLVRRVDPRLAFVSCGRKAWGVSVGASAGCEYEVRVWAHSAGGECGGECGVRVRSASMKCEFGRRVSWATVRPEMAAS